MRITSGSTSEYIYFVAFSTADHVTRVTDLTSFTVFASVAGSTGPSFTSSVSVVNSTQMPGVYKLLLADSTIMTLAATVESREVCLHISSSMDPVTRTIELSQKISNTVWDEAIASTVTARQLNRGYAAAILGKASGLGGTNAVYRNIADSMNVISATVDQDGNRTAVTLDLDDTP